MKQKQTTSWFHIYMLYCTGAQLPFIGWPSGTEPQQCRCTSQQVRKTEVLGNTAMLGNSYGPYTKTWVGEAEETTDAS